MSQFRMQIGAISGNIAGAVAALGLALTAGAAQAGDLNVVTTIKPIHALASAVMQGVGVPRVLIDGSGSPHTFTLKPSDAKTLSAATVFLRVSEGLEPFTIRIVASLPKTVRVVTLENTPGLTLHPLRTGATFEADDDEPAPGKAAQKGAAKAVWGHQQHRPLPSASPAMDGHIWLNPANARVLAGAIAEVLAEADPGHAAAFRANAQDVSRRLLQLDGELAAALEPVKGRPYIVFHDAYQYLEHRYGLTPAGSVTLSPDVPPSAKRLTELRHKIANLKAACVFAEPQFTPKIVETIIEGTATRRGTLDPLGAAIPAGPEQYFTLLRALAADLKSCLGNPA